MQDFATVRSMFSALDDQLAGRTVSELYDDYRGCAVEVMAEPIDYFKYGFFRLSTEERMRYVTRARFALLCEDFNAPVLEDIFADKVLFAQTFGPFLGRTWTSAEPGKNDEFFAFCERVPEAVLKPRSGAYGKKIELVSTQDAETLWRRCCDDGFMLEERIEQHAILGRVHPTSVNCIRVATAVSTTGTVRIVGAVLRCGSKGSFTDSGEGLFAPVDVKTGKVAGPARDHFGNVFGAHPDTGAPFSGLWIPEWESLLRACDEVAAYAGGVRLANWDWACNSEGNWLLVEGNVEGGFGPIQEAWQRGFADELAAALEGKAG